MTLSEFEIRRNGLAWSLPRNSRKTECGAKQFLIPLEVRAAPFAPLSDTSAALGFGAHCRTPVYSNPPSLTIYFQRGQPRDAEGSRLSAIPITLELGRQDAAAISQLRQLRNIHEAFARELSNNLSTFLQSEIVASVGEIDFLEAADFQKAYSSPSCLITLKLFPRQDRIILHFASSTVLGLLELLLGGTGSAPPAASRELTEIEWSLLEEVVRVLVRVLGGAWQPIIAVEFEVESLGSDPAALPRADGAPALIRIGFNLQWGEQTGNFELAVPRALFETAGPAEQQEVSMPEPDQADFKRNLGLLENAQVELEVRLQGPTLAVAEILALKAGQIITFDYSLQKSLHGLVNGDLTIMGHIVSAGRKRAFQVELP
jgi:flagellar motor switch protein FliM